MVVGLFFDLYTPEQNPAVRPWTPLIFVLPIALAHNIFTCLVTCHVIILSLELWYFLFLAAHALSLSYYH